jgi:hypothetical protein
MQANILDFMLPPLAFVIRSWPFALGYFRAVNPLDEVGGLQRIALSRGSPLARCLVALLTSLAAAAPRL